MTKPVPILFFGLFNRTPPFFRPKGVMGYQSSSRVVQHNYEQMQKLICDGSRLNFRFDLYERIVLYNMKPEVDKHFIEIPLEDFQAITKLVEARFHAVEHVKRSLAPIFGPEGVMACKSSSGISMKCLSTSGFML